MSPQSIDRLEPTCPRERMLLQFLPPEDIDHVESPLQRNISASATVGRTLFVACDETSSVERLVMNGNRFEDHRNFNLNHYFDLPNGPDGEMDIEGLAVDSGYLWITGSHSLKRDKPEPGENDRETALQELTEIKCDANRYFLGRVPLQDDGDGAYSLARKARRDDATLRAACIKMSRDSSKLMRILKDDEHFGPFLNAPCKENGFDVEGLAVRGDSVFLGLRGPVLRGWAIIIELALKAPKKGRLKAKRCDASGRRYIKHFLDLDGLGIRDLLLDGDDLLILAGPTMDLDGPAAVYRWRNAMEAERHSVTPRSDLEKVIQLPCGEGTDHPESMVLWERKKQAPLLVLYDSPDPQRLRQEHGIEADLFEIR